MHELLGLLVELAVQGVARLRVEITREFFEARISDRLLVSELTVAEIAATPSEALRRAMAEVADRCETVAVATDAESQLPWRAAPIWLSVGTSDISCDGRRGT